MGFCLARFGILFCSVVFIADTYLKLLDRVVNGACFLASGVLNCDLSRRRSVAVSCMLYKIGCNLKHPLCGALPVPSVPVRVALSKLFTRKAGAGAEHAILPSVGHLQLISSLKIGADSCQLCQYKLTKPNLTPRNNILY